MKNGYTRDNVRISTRKACAGYVQPMPTTGHGCADRRASARNEARKQAMGAGRCCDAARAVRDARTGVWSVAGL